MCADRSDERQLVTLPSGRVLLTDDADFPGYCILEFGRHVTELFELTVEEHGQLIADISAVAQAIWICCSPAKLNYAILGNEVPHLHCHVVPRYPEDGWWGRPIWLRPKESRRALAPEAYSALRGRLRAAIESTRSENR